MPDNQATACFIDTNIWLYAFLETDEAIKSARARALIQENEPVVIPPAVFVRLLG
jgi:predicted nucleic acid-binding protein